MNYKESDIRPIHKVDMSNKLVKDMVEYLIQKGKQEKDEELQENNHPPSRPSS